jgi:phage-related minor tail protein
VVASSSRTVKVKFDGDAKGLKQASGAAENAIAGVQKSTSKLGDFGKKAAGMLGGGLKMGAAGLGIAAAGIGALIVGNVGKALEQGAIKAKLAAQLGATGEDAKRLGKLAGKLYVDGYGESMEATAEMLKTSFENGLVSLKDTDEQIQDVVASVSTYTTLTGEDATAATRAVAQAIKTGLVKDAKQGFDLLVRGQQLGINKAEDLLDTISEYGTQFRKLGLSGEDALGLINQLLQGGARDADTAADAIKEFSIRAVDGSKSSADGYKALGLDAKKMTAEIAKGGPAARTAFGDILDGLNGIKDPVKREAAGVALFGTKWEDLGASIGKADLDTAAKSMGGVAGSVDRANAALSATPAAKLQKTMRTLQQVFIDAIGKYIVPQLDKFATWFNGRGKFVMVDWALAGASAVLGFADTMLEALQKVLGFTAKWGKALLYSMALAVAPFNQGLALSFKKAGDDIGGFSKRTSDELGKARTSIQQTQEKIAKARLVTKLTADKEDLDSKLAAANLALKDPKLTATKRAKLEADIRQLTAAKISAQRQIDSLKGKTVTVNVVQKYSSTGVNLTSPSSVGRRASGGPVSAGRSYLVGEVGPEIITMGANGNVTPNHEIGGGDGPTYLETHIEIGGEVVRVVRSELKQQNRSLKRTVKAGSR